MTVFAVWGGYYSVDWTTRLEYWTTGWMFITVFKMFIVESSRYRSPPVTRFQGIKENLGYSSQYGARGPPVTLLPVKRISRDNYCSLCT